MAILNFNLMKNPINWLTIILMLVIAGMFGHLLLTKAGIEPKTSDSK